MPPPNRILLVIMPLIGDVILATPLLRTLRRAYPQAVIDALVYQGHGAVLAGNPDLNQVLEVTERPRGRELLDLFRRLFRHYDLSFCNSTSDRKILYAVLAARRCITLVPAPRWQDAWKRFSSYGWTELDDQYTHTVVQNLRLADLLGIARCHEVMVPHAEKALQTLEDLLPFNPSVEPYAVLHMAPRWHYKRWTHCGWRTLAKHLIHRGLRVVLTGGGDKQELEYIGAIFAEIPAGMSNLAGKLSFAEVTRLIETCQVYVGPDTAITHIAAATGAPTVALFGPTNPLKWAPWPHGYAGNHPPFPKVGSRRVNNVFLVQGEGECVPCHEEGCEGHKLSSSRCLLELDSERVINAVDTFVCQ
ncbi:MAG: glycosyltransferase family 9 protein [Pseudomonadota bacterium]